MHTWAKRGLQTALVTGGLLMLGTGIASANENVDPDRPASPLDGSINVPLHIDNNVIGTTHGQRRLPGINHDVSLHADDVSGVLGTGGVTHGVSRSTRPVTDRTATLTNRTTGALGGHDVFRGNRVNSDLTVPVDVSGNAIAAGGKATAVNHSQQYAGINRPVTTSGAHDVLAGNVVDVDGAVPVQVTGNAVSLVGIARTHNSSSQHATSTGDIRTSGKHGAGSGNVVAPQFATPIQVTGNALSGSGKATAVNHADSTATAGGHLTSNGSHGVLSGNVGGAPLASPALLNGNPLTVSGKSGSWSGTSADATAGGVQPGWMGSSNYIHTNGDPAVLSGNIAEPGHAGPVGAHCNAGALAGIAGCAGDQSSSTTAGGGTLTSGHGSVLSGSTADTPSTVPVELFGNSGTLAGRTYTHDDNETDTTAGGSDFTDGTRSAGSGSLVTAPLASCGDGFANGVAGAGSASAASSNLCTSTAGGGYAGTIGDDSAGGGNEATVPVALPTELFGNGASAAGIAKTTGTDCKVVTAGGDSNTHDDAGVLASNLATTPLAGAAQGFGNGFALAGRTIANGDAETVSTAGGDATANGTGGAGSGNIAKSPVALPAQVFGNGAAGTGKGQATATNDATILSGGDATTGGRRGVFSGNIADGTVGGAGQLFGNALAVVGKQRAGADNATVSQAGGDDTTTGERGAFAGNIVSPQGMPIVQGFGNAVGLTGRGSSLADNNTSVVSGGDLTSNGDHGFIAGNLFQAPVAAVDQVFGNAAGIFGGVGTTTTESYTDGTVGGVNRTSGSRDQLSGLDSTVPAGEVVQIYNVPVEILGKAFTHTINVSHFSAADREVPLQLPVNGNGLAATELPRVPAFAHPMRSDLPAPSTLPAPAGLPGLNTPGLPLVGGDFGGQLLQLPTLDGLSTGTLPVLGQGTLPVTELPVTQLPVTQLPTGELPTGQLPASRSALPVQPASELPTGVLPVVPATGDLPSTMLAAVEGAFSGDLPLLGHGMPDLSAAALPTTVLPSRHLPTGQFSMSPLPTDLLPVGQLPVGQLPLGGGARSDLPFGQLPVGELPTTVLPVIGGGELPLASSAALPGMDTESVLPFGDLSLADTSAKLQSLFGGGALPNLG